MLHFDAFYHEKMASLVIANLLWQGMISESPDTKSTYDQEVSP